METFTNSLENFNDLVFENKNKTYGAYAIRKSYNEHVTISIGFTTALFGLLVLLAVWFTNNKIEVPLIPSINIPADLGGIIINIDPPIIPDVKIAEPIITKPKTVSGVLVAADDKDKTLDKTTTQMNFDKNPNPAGSDSSDIKEPVNLATAVPKPENTEPVLAADINPEFDGNLFKYLRDNLRYPRNAVEMSTSGTVVLQFIVEKDGSIGNIKTLRDIGDGCTQEAIRVVKAMPNWRPGKNHGEPVRVIFNLPVKFTLQ